MRRFYFDPIFIVLLTIPIPFWLLLKPDYLPLAADQITALITLSLLYPILEELIFRGYLQPWLKTKSDRKFFHLSTANILTSVIFSLSHLVNHSPLWALSTLIPSLVFGYSLDRNKTLLSPIALHASYNFGYFLTFGIN
tara:strand:- start:176 stop:592 length:417 start_codon:yes stop_codon:yes gene_type:complete